MSANSLNVAHLTYQAQSGGAALAVRNLNQALNSTTGIISTIVTSPLGCAPPHKHLHWDKQDNLIRTQYELFRKISDRLLAISMAPRSTWKSYSIIPSFNLNCVNSLAAEIVHLHWVQAGFISLDTIARISKPIVWTLHDLWPLLGSQHIPSYIQDTCRFRLPRLKSKYFIDPYFSYKRYMLSTHSIDFIAPSANIARLASECLGPSTRHRIHIIYNCIEAQTARHIKQTDVASTISSKCPLIVFGAHNFLSDANKGWSIFSALIDSILANDCMVNVEVFGDQRYIPKKDPRIRSHGFIAERAQLQAIYSRATVYASLSCFETFCYSGIEAAFCGSKVVCLDSSSLAEFIYPYELGKVLPSRLGTAQIVREILKYALEIEGSSRVSGLGLKRLAGTLSPQAAGKKHSELYLSAIREKRAGRI